MKSIIILLVCAYIKYISSQEFYAYLMNSRSHLYGVVGGIQSGKYFPQLNGGLYDFRYKWDAANNVPPADGYIASAGIQVNGWLDDPGIGWNQLSIVNPNSIFVWQIYNDLKRIRRFNYFITKDGWNPYLRLSRNQFEVNPIYVRESTTINGEYPDTPTIHAIKLPYKIGYHVMLGVMEIAETGNAFYQVVDLDFNYVDSSNSTLLE